MTNPSVAVCVATYRRPASLSRLLKSLQELDVDFAFDIVVANNDSSPEGQQLFRDVSWPTNRNVRLIQAEEPGIAAARNALLAVTGDAYEFVVFIDDDEVAHPLWLARLLATQRRHQADMVTGPVVYDYAGDVPKWAILGNFMSSTNIGDEVQVTAASTNNLLIRLDSLKQLGPNHFDSRFGLSGGSDIMLTRAFSANGGRIIWCPGALVYERVDGSRASRVWLLKRAIRAGNTDARVSLVLNRESLAQRLRILALGIGRICIGALLVASGPAPSRAARGARGLRMVLRGIGYAAAALDLVIFSYTRSGTKTTGRLC